ncbi:heme biosynthesis HemY N-terminal domain-containing protein [Thalassotalea atypica]|uniref:heme biosynthesis HemY N-terminal domain-containing protein n=1 Tax=Thalassotalea atypica TaxID=2054316 RepID=UPI002574542F|nr:heme biosynthesis HemY N-terminal domain-containing protein [Thalassotalea atypica]
MIKLIVFVLLFFAAVASVPFLIGEKGYILIAMGDITIESSVVTAIIMLTLVFIGLMIVIKIMRGGFKLSLGAWNKIVFASRRRGQRDLNKGIAAFLLGDYQQAEHLLAKSAEPSQQQKIAYLMAASAAQKQDLGTNTDHYLQLVAHQEQELKDVGLENILVQIKILLSREEFNKARELIDEHHRHIGHDARLLALEIDLCLIEKRFEKAIEWLNKARKEKSIDNDKVIQWEKAAFTGHLNLLITATDRDALFSYWQKLPRKLKQNHTVLLAYCQVLAEHKIIEPLEKLILPVVKKGADTSLINGIKALPLSSCDDLIIAVEKHLHKNPEEQHWLSCLGHFAYAGQKLTLAEKAFNTLYQKSTTKLCEQDIKVYAKTLLSLEKHEQAAKLLLNPK